MGWRYNLGPSVRLNLEGIRREVSRIVTHPTTA